MIDTCSSLGYKDSVLEILFSIQGRQQYRESVWMNGEEVRENVNLLYKKFGKNG